MGLADVLGAEIPYKAVFLSCTVVYFDKVPSFLTNTRLEFAEILSKEVACDVMAIITKALTIHLARGSWKAFALLLKAVQSASIELSVAYFST